MPSWSLSSLSTLASPLPQRLVVVLAEALADLLERAEGSLQRPRVLSGSRVRTLVTPVVVELIQGSIQDLALALVSAQGHGNSTVESSLHAETPSSVLAYVALLAGSLVLRARLLGNIPSSCGCCGYFGSSSVHHPGWGVQLQSFHCQRV